MSTNNQLQVAYGFSQPQVNVMESIQSNRAPTANDKAPIATIWVNKLTNSGYILTSVVNNVANWEAFGTGTGTNSFVTDAGTAIPAGGVIDIAGGSNINTSGAGSTVTVNLDNNVTISGTYTTTGGNVDLANTNVGGTRGVINFGGASFIQNLGTSNTFVGENAGNFTLTTASANDNVFMGTNAGTAITTAHANVLIGVDTGNAMTTGNSNTLIGAFAGMSGNFNNTVAIGEAALFSYTGTGENLAIGTNALGSLLTGVDNCVIGTEGSSGGAYDTNESQNILIQNPGTVGDNDTIRIGTPGDHNLCFISGITGVTVTGAAVLCSTTGQLGTISSSRRFKENITDIQDLSVLSLRPVKFNYKNDTSMHYGLIAEEVEETFKDLVLYDQEGLPQSVAYHELPALLLNEVKKLRKELDDMKKSGSEIKNTKLGSMSFT